MDLKDYDAISKSIREAKFQLSKKEVWILLKFQLNHLHLMKLSLIANSYSKVYKEFNLLDNRKQVSRVKEFLFSQRTEKLNELIHAEDNLKNYQLKRWCN